jgi:hypothetical protein
VTTMSDAAAVFTAPGPGAGSMVAVPRQAAEEAGLVSRVLADAVVWDDCVTWTEADSAEGSGAGRPGALPFTVEWVPRATAGREAEKVTLTVTAGRSPRGTVAVTIGPARANWGTTPADCPTSTVPGRLRRSSSWAS